MARKDVPPSSAEKLKLTPAERRARRQEKLAALRLRFLIGQELEDRGIASPAEIGAALGLPADEAANLLSRRQWREGEVARLEAAAARLGLPTGNNTADSSE